MFPPPPLPARNVSLAHNGGTSAIWSTMKGGGDIHAAQSYRDVRCDVDMAALALSQQSRENTLSRDLVNHHSVSTWRHIIIRARLRDLPCRAWVLLNNICRSLSSLL